MLMRPRFFTCSLPATILCLGMLLIPVLPRHASAQGLLAPAPATPDPVDTRNSDLLEKADPLVDQLNDRAALGGTDLAVAIASLVRIGEWPAALRWLAKVDGVQDQNQLAQMAKVIGPNVLLKLSSRRELGDAERSTIKKLFDAAKSSAEDKGKIAAAITDIASPSVDKRLAAIRTLLQGGNASVAALAAAAAKNQSPEARDEILRTLLAIDPRGINAIEQLAMYGPPAARENALLSLIRLGASESQSHCVSALYAQEATNRERQIAADALREAGVSVGRQQAVTFLLHELERLSGIAEQTPNDPQQTMLWSLAENRTEVVVQRCQQMLAAYRDVYDAAARLNRLGGLPIDVARRALLGELSYQVVIDADWGMPDQIAAISAKYPENTSAAELLTGLAMANAQQNVPVAVGMLRLLSNPAGGLSPDELLRADGASMTPLVQSVQNPIPRVRYEAGEVIAGLDDSLPYAGSSYVRQCWAEMSRLGDRPVAILVETRPDVILQQSSILAQMGFRTEPVQSVRELEREVALGGDLRMILAKTELWDMPPVELIDRVRRLPEGRRLPVVFYGQEFDGIDTGRWDAESILVEMPATPSAFAEIRSRISTLQRLPDLTVLDRQHYRQVATEAIKASAK
ncbi:hypothetical protein [Stieleria varia]|uniref:Uncharacterized protein n=1 Tax=Stieleria varia TaxID=2528005 RepID=A0A5C6B2H4_9BACT|nr:hypothetical protein [Stieleria varia]TWU05642.1 hypothetical protein Pla52n_13570 [Stieleria varia]